MWLLSLPCDDGGDDDTVVEGSRFLLQLSFSLMVMTSISAAILSRIVHFAKIFLPYTPVQD